MLAAVVGVVGVVVGGAVQWLLNRLSDEKRREWAVADSKLLQDREDALWQRDRRADLYTRVIVEHGRLMLDASALKDDVAPTADEIEAATELRDRNLDHMRALMDVLMELQVLGSKRVHELANAVGADIVRLGANDETVKSQWGTLLSAIRTELGVED